MPRKTALGILMGMVMLIPGISAGTVALVFGVHRQLMADISKLKIRRLFHIIAGVIVGVVVGVNLIGRAMDAAPELTLSFFLGVMVVAVYHFMWRHRPEPLEMPLIFGGFLVAWMLPSLGSLNSISPGPPAMFLAGAVSGSAMVLPGISGGAFLVLLKMYVPVMNAAQALQWLRLLWFAAGGGLGVFLSAITMNYLFCRERRLTLAVLGGLMTGSLRSLYPDSWRTSVLLSFAAGALFALVLMLLSRRQAAGDGDNAK